MVSLYQDETSLMRIKKIIEELFEYHYYQNGFTKWNGLYTVNGKYMFLQSFIMKKTNTEMP